MTLLHGYDISAYQSNSAPAGDFVIVKATEGASYTSSHFTAQWKSAKSKARHRGAYHFAHPEQSSAASQAGRFLDLVQPAAGESVWLDLETSGLSQAATNTWARAWGDYMREHAPGITSGVYLGSGYAGNNTGRGLSKHFARWWYPQYPSTYQLQRGADVEVIRAVNRSHLMPGRTPIAAMTTKWPPAVSPWLPAANTTGWATPDIWQFTDHWGSAQLDASVTALTLDQLAGGGQNPLEDDMYAQAAGFPPPLKVGERHSHTCPSGSVNIWGFWFDSPHTLTYRIAAHSHGGHGEVEATLVVGGPKSPSDTWPAKPTWKTKLTDVDAFSIELVAAEGPTPDWDPTQPGADGKTVLPGWDASHTA